METWTCPDCSNLNKPLEPAIFKQVGSHVCHRCGLHWLPESVLPKPPTINLEAAMKVIEQERAYRDAAHVGDMLLVDVRNLINAANAIAWMLADYSERDGGIYQAQIDAFRNALAKANEATR